MFADVGPWSRRLQGVSASTQPAFPQGTPLKYDSGPGSKKHDVRSIIGSPGRTFPPVHPLDVIADPRALERACFEESLKGRSGAVSSAGGSITRGAPVIVPELGKPRQSPLAYEDHGAPFTGHLPRGSPVTTREPTPRLQEGAWGWLWEGGSEWWAGLGEEAGWWAGPVNKVGLCCGRGHVGGWGLEQEWGVVRNRWVCLGVDMLWWVWLRTSGVCGRG